MEKQYTFGKEKGAKIKKNEKDKRQVSNSL